MQAPGDRDDVRARADRVQDVRRGRCLGRLHSQSAMGNFMVEEDACRWLEHGRDVDVDEGGVFRDEDSAACQKCG